MEHFETPQILREIGRGGMGIVYEARLNNLPCAVKLLTFPQNPAIQSPADQSDSIARFEREIQVLRDLPKHPNIISLLASGQSPEGPWFAMDLIPGGTLAEAIARDRALDPEQTRRIALGIARALAVLHERGIIHRDLKADNILLEADEPVLTDFGIARDRALEAMTRTGVVLGTPRSIAPEQLAGMAPDPASDLWALGVLLFECLTGKPPFAAHSPVELAAAIVNSPPPPLPDTTPKALERLVIDLLNKNPNHRPDINETIARLENISSLADHSAPHLRNSFLKKLIFATSALILILGLSSILVRTLQNYANKTKSIPSNATLSRELRSQAPILIADALLKQLTPASLKSPLSPEALQQARDRFKQIREILELNPQNDSKELRKLINSIVALDKPRPWPPSLAALESALNNPELSLREPAAALWQTLQIPGPELPNLTKTLIAAHHRSYQEASEFSELLDSSPSAWADWTSLHNHLLEEWAFASLTSPTDRPRSWQRLLARSPQPADFRRWNQRAESILQSLETKPGLELYLAWEELCLQTPELRRPLASAPIHRARGELGGAEPRADREFEQFSHFMTSAEVVGTSVIALGTRLLMSRSRVLRERHKIWSLAERRMIYDMLVLNARHGVLPADSFFLAAIDAENITEIYLRDRPPLSEELAKTFPNLIIDEAFQSYANLSRLSRQRENFSENRWIQSLTQLRNILPLIPLTCATPIPESHFRGALLSGLAEGLRNLTPSARARTWQELGINDQDSALKFLNEQLKKSSGSRHAFPDGPYLSYASIIHSSLLPEAKDPSALQALERELQQAYKSSFDWTIIRILWPKLTGRFTALCSADHFVFNYPSATAAVDRMIRIALIATPTFERPANEIQEFFNDIQPFISEKTSDKPSELTNWTILCGLASATDTNSKDPQKIQSALQATALARRSLRDHDSHEELDLLFREALQKIEDLLQDSARK